jgi:hypothetical protein
LWPETGVLKLLNSYFSLNLRSYRLHPNNIM